MDAQGNFSNKGWDFKDNWAEALSRKIRYIRFNHETDPVFIKLGGLDNVTLGYGLVMSGFTNMLNYPDKKLLGMQFYLNDITPLGIDLQTTVGDFLDIREEGGLYGARMAIRPMKPLEIPILSGLSIGGLWVQDVDQYAEGRKWKSTLDFNSSDSDNDGVDDLRHYEKAENGLYETAADTAWVQTQINEGDIDTYYKNPELEIAENSHDGYAIWGLDLGLPLIQSKIVNLTLYGQYGMSVDDGSPTGSDTVDASGGWGIGAPGALLTVGPFRGQLEYRYVDGNFEPGYFGPYYYAERLLRKPLTTKDALLTDVSLSGVFGTMTLQIGPIAQLSGSYQWMGGTKDKDEFDQRAEATLGLGSLLLSKIPKITKAEAFIYKTQIMRTIMKYNDDGTPKERDNGKYYYDTFAQETPNMYWGYRLGAEVLPGTMITWETRNGWELDQNYELQSNNSVSITAGLVF